jgi:ATP-dependent Clp protease ATP-binding subunit ClpB
MPPSFNNFTTKAKEVIRRAHELAIERGQNQVNPLHLMGALLTQEESLVHAILEKLEIDVIHLTDTIVDAIEVPGASATMSQSYQMYLTPELASTLEASLKVAQSLGDEFVSTEHLLSLLARSVKFSHASVSIKKRHITF